MSPRARTVALAAVVLLIAANLRPAVVGVSPLAPQIRADLGVGSAVTGLLTAVPVFCFGLLAPVAGRLGRRFGLETTLLVALVVLTAGIVLRLAPSLALLMAGGVLAGLAIAIGNTLMPVVVKRDFRHHTGPMTGAYSTMISGGGALAAAVTVPIEGLTGLGWRPALALWGAFAALAVLLWIPWVRRARRQRGTAGEAPAPVVRGLWRTPLAWQVTATMGLQSLQFYALTAWAPTLFVEDGATPAQAGLLLSLAGLCSLPSSLLTPILAARRPSQHHLLAVLITLWTVGYLGLLLEPFTLGWLWMALIGLGQGVGISLALTLITLRSPDAAHTAELSGMAQGVGYMVAAFGPFALGALRDATGSWTAPLITLLVLLVPLTIAGIGAARNRHVGRPPGEPDVDRATDQDTDPAAANGHAAPDGAVRGRVCSVDGTPLAGATVTLVDARGRELARTRTGPDGAYALDAPDEPALLICAAATHAPQARHLSPVLTGPTDLDLAPAAATEWRYGPSTSAEPLR